MSRKNQPHAASQMGLFALAEPDQAPLLDPTAIVKPVVKQTGFFATSSDDVIVTGAKAKVMANLDAVLALYAIEDEKRLPTDAELAIMARYSAFGGTPKVFDDREDNPERLLHIKVKALLHDADYKSARAATPNAFYTSPEIIAAMWKYVQHLGFTGGRVLEPSAATGLFFAGMPEEIRAASELTAVELDPLSGRMGQYLHPDVKYNLKGLQEVDLTADYFDLTISNIPFGDYRVFDPTFTKDEVALSYAIHNYFFVKAVKLTRPGGLIAFVTSRYMMDSKGDAVRAYLADHCRLLGAVRLPSHTFAKFSGTDVVTDIIFLQKLAEGEMAEVDPLWRNAGSVMLSGGKLLKEQFWINRYFLQNPDRILGSLQCRTGRFSAQLNVVGDLDESTFTERILLPLPTHQEPPYKPVARLIDKARATLDVAFTDVRNGSFGYMTVGGVRTVYQKVANEAVPVKKTGKALERLLGMIDLVTYARNVLKQCIGGNDELLAVAQLQLNEGYDKFVAEHGCLSDTVNRRLFYGDPNATFLLALEKYDPERKTATKTKLFSERTVRVHSRPTSAATASDALAISLNEYGSLNMPFMMELYDKSAEEIIAELGTNIYYDPARGAWVTGDEYLSGNVVKKLQEVKATNDPGLTRNIEALEAVQPERLTPDQIVANMGGTWIPAKYLEQFVIELLAPNSLANNIDVAGHSTKHPGRLDRHYWFRIEIKYVPSLSKWVIAPSERLKYNEMATRKWGTSRRDIFDLVESQLNGTEISIYDKEDDVYVFNPTESIAAREKSAEIGKLFRKWAWMDKERSADLCKIYNDTFRCLVERQYDGTYLTFPNTSLDLPEFHAHQRNAIARAMLGGSMLLWHAVGAGKTWTMIVAAMEMKRLGLRNKPIHVVPGHLLEQYAVEFYRVYPNARILVIDSYKMSPQEKQVSLARIATEDWDSVLITHGAFQRIPLKIETWEWLVDEQVAELEQAIEEMKDDYDQRFTVKKLEAKKFGLEARLQQRRARAQQDKGGLFFEDLGLDMLLVDEMHTFKSLYFLSARTHIAGIGGSDAGIAYDMFIKSQYVQRRCTNGHILGERRKQCACGADNVIPGSLIGATGTAITNSISEMYTLQRFFQMDTLIDVNIASFDAWAAQFGQSKWVIEMEASGRGWRTKERFIEFVNVPELLAIFKQVADICIDPRVLKLQRPAIMGGKPKPIEIQPSKELLAFIDKCAARAENLPNVKPYEDNMLAIMGDSSRAATDLRLVDIMLDHPESKINTVVKNVYEIWKDTGAVQLEGLPAPVGLAQLVFLDVGVPGGAGYPLYQDMKDKWVNMGIPAEQIAFAHDASTDAAKKALYNSVNAGNVRIIIGTTGKLGAGVNMQRVLFALHHCDAPWTPALMEQREGRIFRPGNLNKSIWIFRYTVVNSLDFHKWHLLELKAAANAQLFMGDPQTRVVSDLDQAVIGFAEMRAMATGNPLIIEQVQLRAQLNKLNALYDKYYHDRRRVQSELSTLPTMIDWNENQIRILNLAIEYRKTFAEKPDLIVDGKVYDKRVNAAEHFHSLMNFDVQGQVLDMGYAKVSFITNYANKKYARVEVGPARFDVELSNSPVGNLTRIDNDIDSMPSMVRHYEKIVGEMKARLTRLEFEAKASFDREEERDTAQKRLNEIDLELHYMANQTKVDLSVAKDEGEDDDNSETSDDDI